MKNIQIVKIPRKDDTKTIPKEAQEVIQKLAMWHIEAKNPRNDGWVQGHYKQALEAVEAKMTEITLSLFLEDSAL